VTRQRRPIPALVIAALLLATAVVVWIRVLNHASDEAAGTCPPPAPASTSGAAAPGQATDPGAQATAEPRVLPSDALDTTDPLPPDAVKLRVLNANGQRGQAGTVTSQLRGDLGFRATADPTNDPLHPDYQLTCLAQIRFGAAGAAAARTVSLVAPCAELMQDSRGDDGVDLALGTKFSNLAPNAAAKDALKQLATQAAGAPGAAGGQQGEPPATVDKGLLAQARATTC
jgi:hypothetical protein